MRLPWSVKEAPVAPVAPVVPVGPVSADTLPEGHAPAVVVFESFTFPFEIFALMQVSAEAIIENCNKAKVKMIFNMFEFFINFINLIKGFVCGV